jgi:hypothetical protein
VVFNDKIWILGGDRIPVNNYLNDVWFSSDGTDWTQATANSPWSARGGHSSVAFQDKLWVLGGCMLAPVPDNVLNDVWCSTDGIHWTRVTSHAQWSERFLHNSVVFQEKIWIIGGYAADMTRKTDVWCSTDGFTWTQVGEFPFLGELPGVSCIVHNGEIWVIGGDVWHSPDGLSWTQATSLPGQVHDVKLVDFGGRIWVVGGQKFDGESWVYSNDILSSTNGLNWAITAMNSPSWQIRGGHSCAVMDDRVFLFSGSPDGGPDIPDVWCTEPHLQFALVPIGGLKAEGDTLSLSVDVSATIGTVTYQWYKNDSMLTGETMATFQKVGIDGSDAGSYTCRVSDESLVYRDTPPALVSVHHPGGEGEGGISLTHSADQDGDNQINLTELLRIIQFFNSGGFHCAVSPVDTEDGYVAGPGDEHECAPHGSDYNLGGPNWIIELTELLRLIQFFNSGGYRSCPGYGTEDGYCPGLGE